jgi:hypothetical protein
VSRFCLLSLRAALRQTVTDYAETEMSQKRASTATASQPAPKRGRTGGKSGASHAKLTFKSPAEFFAENKNIAGFDKYVTLHVWLCNSAVPADVLNCFAAPLSSPLT